ncbi:hypothetical protein [Desulfacinum hydrothermale]|uniref:hypothetical protein n=1 Tax=Desulfacinum hydrothermale TaxID=109258 RepID=UPI000A03416F|nr:hypothetical protein [Desulfacinum hydrothermale]
MEERREKTCSRCAGTGLVCAHEPVIRPGACCVDYANAICPDCGGTGRIPAGDREPGGKDGR